MPSGSKICLKKPKFNMAEGIQNILKCFRGHKRVVLCTQGVQNLSEISLSLMVLRQNSENLKF